MKVSEIDINGALALLAEHFPADRRDIWCKDNVEPLEKPYTARLGSNDELGLESESGWGFTAIEAAENLIARAGERNPDKIRQQRIAELKRQLAELEAQEPDLVKSVQA